MEMFTIPLFGVEMLRTNLIRQWGGVYITEKAFEEKGVLMGTLEETVRYHYFSLKKFTCHGK